MTTTTTIDRAVQQAACVLIRKSLGALGFSLRVIDESVSLTVPGGSSPARALVKVSTEGGLGGGDWWPSLDLQDGLEAMGLYLDSENAGLWYLWPIAPMPKVHAGPGAAPSPRPDDVYTISSRTGAWAFDVEFHRDSRHATTGERMPPYSVCVSTWSGCFETLSDAVSAALLRVSS